MMAALFRNLPFHHQALMLQALISSVFRPAQTPLSTMLYLSLKIDPSTILLLNGFGTEFPLQMAMRTTKILILVSSKIRTSLIFGGL